MIFLEIQKSLIIMCEYFMEIPSRNPTFASVDNKYCNKKTAVYESHKNRPLHLKKHTCSINFGAIFDTGEAQQNAALSRAIIKIRSRPRVSKASAISESCPCDLEL